MIYGFLKREKNKVGQNKRDKRSLKTNLFLSASFDIVSVSPVLFWVQQFLEVSWPAKNLTQLIQQPLENPCGLSMATPRSSQKFPDLCVSVYFFLWTIPRLPPHAESQRVICSLCRTEIQTFVQLGQAWHCKSCQSVPSFIQDICLLASCFTSFPCRCLGVFFHLIKTHMQQRDFQSTRSYVVWNATLKWLFHSTDYRGRHRKPHSGPSSALLCQTLQQINLCHIT